ncbi:MAG: hypothetical protein ACYTES_10145 [Planctomycetota bacterium]|jgi:AAA family ATP:ADP antiporter
MTRSFSTRWFKVQPGELGALAWSCAYFFCLLAAYYILRPQREAMAAAGGVRNLKWLYLGTLTAMLLCSWRCRKQVRWPWGGSSSSG